MDWLDPVLLGRIQFTLTAVYHFIFVPLSIGIGLIMAIFETKAFRSGSDKDAAAARFWAESSGAYLSASFSTAVRFSCSSSMIRIVPNTITLRKYVVYSSGTT